jgi:transcriptional regulator with XRE-family HTH domain
MEFNEKLQLLRKQKGYTQEELAELLFVSRTAISKWESGRGYPSIDSLKAISNIFSITIDELLSGEEIIEVAKKEKKENSISLRTVQYGLFDIMSFVFLFIPLFGERNGDYIESVNLFSLDLDNYFIYILYVIILSVIILFGIVELTLQNNRNYFWLKSNAFISISLTVFATILFIISQQPYIAFFEFWLLIIKGFLYIKQH